jgi:hypothetical protein
MTLNEIVYNILNVYRGGNISDNEKITKKQIAAMVNYYRSLLIKRELDKRTDIDKNLVSDLGCVPVIEVDSAECCEIESKCTVYRTKMKIPAAVGSSVKQNLFTFVGLVDKVTPFQFSTKPQVYWGKHNRYTANVRKAYYHNGYLYVSNPEEIEYINIQGIFEDPLKLDEFNKCKGSGCFGWDEEYPVSPWMISTITEMILSKELRTHQYKSDYKTMDMYKFYRSKYPVKSKHYLTYKEFSVMVKKFNAAVIDEIIDNKEFKMPFGLGVVSIRKRKTNTSNYKRLRIDFGHYNKTGEKIKHLNLHSGMFYYLFYWKKGKVTNIGSYRLKFARTVTRRLASEIKSNGRDYFEV